MEPSADPVFEALGLCQNGVANEDTTQTAQFQPPGFLQMQMQQMQMQQIQQQVMYAVQAHVQQQIQQTAESGTGQDATFKNPEAISAFAAAATTAALFYCQSLQGSMAPPIPEVPMAPYAWGTPPGWQMPWYPTGPCANEAAPEAPKEEVLCTPKKETGEHNSDGVTPSPVQHLNFGATPSDYGTAGYATLSPMILKRDQTGEVVNTDCQSPTTASDRPSTGWQSETPEENAGAMLLQLLKGGAKEESRPAEGHITPSTASEEGGDSQRQALASSGQELLRQLRGGAEAKAQKGTSGKATHVRRAKNGEVRVLQI